ncbi:uncharacterized protein ASPGLDRAFT_42540 [Aspergillus glaucus CBS 516.65]|uniref:SnoaL-like domain-containing protein n=1 Tax=Aspergillus glaucus CBS 516.65 TaxID=1160497 RepID=A0A1L9VUE7_ASPGL|nr:hypothetical protein ASPGLDRAFT_42540 [Aspergillus glaucus CBS 516.65]OJJ87520.1 hypothetical protein ASPGLDRAFT_42540 [Aspergillus glaucus CBS 516.65]
MAYNGTAKETQPKTWLHLNGTVDQILDRYCVSELARGWLVYVDYSEWKNYRNCFTDDAWVLTLCSNGSQPIDDFVKNSQKGREKGVFMAHRELGTLVDLNPSTNRAVGKMKVTITQRFIDPSTKIEYDIDCDARFIMYCLKTPVPENAGNPVPGTGLGPRASSGGWKIQFVKLIYEKDKVVSVDGKSVPTFSKEELDKYAYAHRYLAAARARQGEYPRTDMSTLTETEQFWNMYHAIDEWLNGHDVSDVKKTLGI